MPHVPVPEAVKPGLKGESSTVVCEHNVASHVQTLSTPAMIGLMERAAVNALHPHLAEGQTSVGYEVNVRHLAPTPIGQRVRCVAEVMEVQGNKVLFKVEAHDEQKKTGEGTHRRAIVSRGSAKQS